MKTKSERDDFEKRLTSLSATQGEWQDKHKVLSTEHEHTQKSLAMVKGERDQLASGHKSLQSQHATTQQTLSKLQAQVNQVSSQLSTSSMKLSSTQNELASSSRRLEDAEATIKDLRKENEELLSGLNEVRPKIVELNADKVELGETIEHHVVELRARDTTIADLEGVIDQANTRIHELELQHGDNDRHRLSELNRLEEMTREQQEAYATLEEELQESQAAVRELSSERISSRHTLNQLQGELDRLHAKDKGSSHELDLLRRELDERASSGNEVTEMLGTLREEVEGLRTDLSLKEEEIIRTRAQLEEANLLLTASSSTQELAPSSSLNEEMIDSLKQQHSLELSEAMSQIRTLETSVFQEQAKTHTLQRRVTALEDEIHMLNMQLASASVAPTAPVQRLNSPLSPLPSRNSALSLHTNGVNRSAPSKQRAPRRDSNLVVPPHPAIDSALSPEARHKRKVSLSMLKARIESEMGPRRIPLATTPNGHNHRLGTLTEQDEHEDSHHRRKAMAMLSRPQFGDETHVFCCASCKGDLVVL